MGLVVQRQQLNQLLDYIEQLQRWNRSYNLTAIRDPEQMLTQHILDCLAVVAPLKRATARSGHPEPTILDVGSGAGLPGVVLAIMLPAAKVTCVDAVEKKMAFVRQMCGVLGLSNEKPLAAFRFIPPPRDLNVLTRLCLALHTSIQTFAW